MDSDHLERLFARRDAEVLPWLTQFELRVDHHDKICYKIHDNVIKLQKERQVACPRSSSLQSTQGFSSQPSFPQQGGSTSTAPQPVAKQVPKQVAAPPNHVSQQIAIAEKPLARTVATIPQKGGAPTPPQVANGTPKPQAETPSKLAVQPAAVTESPETTTVTRMVRMKDYTPDPNE